MDFKDMLLVAQQNQKQQSSHNYYYKSRFDPPKREPTWKNKLSENVKKFLAKKEEEEKQKELEAKKNREKLIAMRDPKRLKNIQKSLKVIKSANKSVIEDAVDRNNTAVTLYGPDQPDQDDYGYVSPEASAFYDKIMEKYSKLPEEPKFPIKCNAAVKNLANTNETIKNTWPHVSKIVPNKNKHKKDIDKEISPPKKRKLETMPEKNIEKTKVKKSEPRNIISKSDEKKKIKPINIAATKQGTDPEQGRLMTKKPKIECEKQLTRPKRRQEKLETESDVPRKHRKVEKHQKITTTNVELQKQKFPEMKYKDKKKEKQSTHQMRQTDKGKPIEASSSDSIRKTKGHSSLSKQIFNKKTSQKKCSDDNKLQQTKPETHMGGFGHASHKTKQAKSKRDALRKKIRLLFYYDSDDVSEVSSSSGNDKSRNRDPDDVHDDDDLMMESTYAKQKREEYFNRKMSIIKALEEMRLEAKMKKKNKKKNVTVD